MAIPYSFNPMGVNISPYKPGQTLCNIANGQTQDVTFFQGVYFIRAQGGGGKGGNYGYPYNHGSGGASGAGFVGYIRIKQKLTVTVSAGLGGIPARPDGTATVIPNIMSLGGGGGGPSTTFNPACPSGTPGALSLNENQFFSVVSSTVRSNGNAGCKYVGGNSVVTGDGAGEGTNPASKPGAGGGGTASIGGVGGNGGHGECLIQFSSF